jgi:hypothetical protein
VPVHQARREPDHQRIPHGVAGIPRSQSLPQRRIEFGRFRFPPLHMVVIRLTSPPAVFQLVQDAPH